MGVIRHKIWSDLWANKARTIQVVLIIGMGAFAIGMIITTRNLTIQGMDQIWHESSPPMIGMILSPGVDEETIISMRRIDGVVGIEGSAMGTIEWRESASDEWRSAGVSARVDYRDQVYSIVDLTKGVWPEEDTVAVGQGSDVVFGLTTDDMITVRVDDREITLTVTGTVSDPLVQPPSFGGNAQLYVTRDTFEDLFNTRSLNRILASAQEYELQKVTVLANQIRDKLEKQDVDSFGFLPPTGTRVVDPNKHFFQDAIDGIFLVLTIMAVLALLLGLFLVYNTINAIISQQIDQIGVMKAIGASSLQILSIYLLYVLCFGILALLIAVPLGALGGWLLNTYLMNSFNAEPGAFTVSWPAIAAQIIISIVTPILVAIVPLTKGARITVREAISSYGLDGQTSLLDRLISRLKRVSRLLLLTISNTFRHKGRVVLTQITLVLSGLIFMMVMSVGDSSRYTFNDLLFSILNSNINMIFVNPQRIQHMETIAESYPGVTRAEMWAFGSGTGHEQSRPATDDDPGVTLFGVPADTTLYGYQLRKGRWLLQDDVKATVINQELAKDLQVSVGDWVTFDQGVIGESDWYVVGLVFDPLLSNTAHIPRDALLREQNQTGRTNSIWIQLEEGDAANEQTTATALRQIYEDLGLDMAPGGALNGQDTSSEVIQGINAQFESILFLLATMAVVIGIVGSISLSGVLSLSVIERQREIGVMRAIGASTAAIYRLFIGEGLILGWLSWLIAFPLSLPAGKLMTTALSSALGTEIVFHYTPRGALIWLLIITVLAALASWLPARRASRISVRQSLAYQ
ncbi:MAG: ABC transporter permease [Candidatus Promineifilaceae bacterium]|nr:ABC transporter permease [Candidatus Promineifilaceae bacterium]